ncbi:MAG: type II secretion system protein [Chloroflexi bacterium]|nr:MAG: type II secretion system protein [Chloroflexota bacterium]
MKSNRGFTIVELLIVIVVIGILAAITIVAFNGIQNRANDNRRNSEMAMYLKAILAARINSDKTLFQVNNSAYSMGTCTMPANNPDGTEPRLLDKTHACWVRYRDNLAKIGAASGMDLSGLQNGDPKGNPYTYDENEGEPSGGVPNNCATDTPIRYFTGSGTSLANGPAIPKYLPAC